MAAAGTRVGTGYVEIKPDFSRFQEVLGKRLHQALTPAFRKAGSSAGREIARGADRPALTQALRPLLRRFERFGDDAGEAIAKKIGKGAKRTEGDMFGLAGAVAEVEHRTKNATSAAKSLETDMFGIGRAAKSSGRQIVSASASLRDWHRQASAGSTSTNRLRDRLRGMGGDLRQVGQNLRRAGAGFGNFDGFMARTNRSAQFFRNVIRTLAWPVLIASVGLAAQGLSALAAGAIATSSALGPLAGALVALPAGALAAAQAFSVLKLATAGVGDALKAALDVETSGGAQAVDVMRQQRDAADRVADAKRNLTNVQEQARIAQDDLREARESATRQLKDMRLASDRSRDSEQEAVLSLRQARQDLMRTLSDPAASGLDVRFAEEAVDQARHDLEQTRLEAKRARQDYRDAQKKGVEGMPEVVAAKRAEKDAAQAAEAADRNLQRAIEDSTAAMKDQGAAASALQEKMAQLPPAAQSFVRLLVSMKPKLDALRATAAEGLFPGVEDGLRGAMGNFRVIRSVVGRTASVFGDLATKAGRKLGSAVWGKDLSRLGKLNTRILRRLGDAGLNVADVFRHILVAAKPFLDWLSESTVGLSKWIKGEAAAGRETGRLAAFFDRTRQAMELLGPILKGVGGGLLNVAEAARPLGNEILKALGDAAEGWRRWTDSTKGQNRLRNYFTETKPAIFEMGRLIRDIGKAFFELGRQQGVAHLLRLVRTELVPALRDLVGATTGWASGFLKEFGRLRKQGTPAFEAFVQVLAEHAAEAGWKIAKALVNAFLNASIWGKLAIAGFLLSKFGGLQAFASLGARAGGRMGKAFVEKVIAWFAGTEAGMSLYVWLSDAVGPNGKLGKLARNSGTRLGKTFGRGLVVGVIAGLALAAPSLMRWVEENISNPLRSSIEGALDSVGLDVVGDFFSYDLFNPFGFGGGGDTESSAPEIPAPKTEKAERRFHEFGENVVQSADQARKGFRSRIDLLPEIAGRSGMGINRQMLPRLEHLATEGGRKGEAFAGRLGGSFGGLASLTRDAFLNIGANLGEMLGKLGATKTPKFNLKKFAASLPELKPIGRQTGGFIVPGTGSGDKFQTMLPAGSFVLNREATAAFGFQSGGLLPVALEAKERVFTPPEVSRIGAGNLAVMNQEVPRHGFQGGGRLGPEPQIAGPMGALRSMGQQAIKRVYEGAKDFMAKQSPVGPGGVALGTGPGQLGALEKLGGTFGLSVTSGYRPGDDGWHGQNRARDFGGSASQMLAFAMAVARKWGRRLLELIHTPLGWGIKNGQRVGLGFWGPEVNADHFDHVHAAMQRGGLLTKLQSGGFAGNINRIFAEHNSASGDWGGETLPSYLVAALAEAAGKTLGINVPGVTMEQVTRGESGAHRRNSARPGATGIDPGGTKGLGLWMITNGFNDELIAKYGGEAAMRNPVRNAAAMAEIFGSAGLGAWYGKDSVTGSNLHYTGSFDLRKALGGQTYAEALGRGAGSAPGESVPANYKGAKTGELNFGPLPKSLEGVNREIERLESDARIYRKARSHAEKNGKPGVAQAVGRNVEAIEARLRALREARTRLRLQKAKKALSKRLKGTFGKFGTYDRRISLSERGYLQASQFAEQVVGVEPQPPELPANASTAERESAEKEYVTRFTQYVEGPERSAYGSVLGRVADWRNTVLRAELFGFGKGEPSVAGASTRWEGQAHQARGAIEHIKAFSEKVAQRIREFNQKHQGAALPDWLKKQIKERDTLREQLPLLNFKDKQLTGAIGKARELFFPGGEKRLQPPAIPLPGSGALETALEGIQGIHWPDQHELLPPSALAPPRAAGRFGGIIWDVQTSIEELGLKIRQAASGIEGSTGGSEGDDEKVALLEELLSNKVQREAVKTGLGATLEEFDAMREWAKAKVPKFHEGGVVPGPAHREQIALLRGQERVRTPEQEVALAAAVRGLGAGSPSVVIERLIVHEDGTASMEVAGQLIDVAVERRMTQRSAVGPRVPGGTRI